MVRPPSLVRRDAGRLDGPTARGPGSCRVLLAAVAERARGQRHAGPLLRTAASWQPPHVSDKYSTSDHLLSRVLPRYDAGSEVGNEDFVRTRRSLRAHRSSVAHPVGEPARRPRDRRATSTGRARCPISQTASAACRSATVRERVPRLPAGRGGAARTAAHGVVPARMPVAPSGVVCSVAAGRPTPPTPVGASSTMPVRRDEASTSSAPRARLAQRGHVHRVRQRLDARRAARARRRTRRGVTRASTTITRCRRARCRQ